LRYRFSLSAGAGSVRQCAIDVAPEHAEPARRPAVVDQMNDA